MLARRFTIVCLLSAMVGMGFATLVSHTSRDAHLRSVAVCGTLDASCPAFDWSRR